MQSYPSTACSLSRRHLSRLLLLGVLAPLGCRPAPPDKTLDPALAVEAVKGEGEKPTNLWNQSNEVAAWEPKAPSGTVDTSSKQSDAPLHSNENPTAVGSTDVPPAADGSSARNSNSGSVLKEGVVKDPVEKVRPVLDDPSENWIEWNRLPLEIWELSFLGQRPVGTTSRSYQKTRGLEGDVVRVELNSISRVSIDGKTSLQRLQLTTQELPNGQILRLEGSLQIGDINNRFSGVIADDQLRVDMVASGKPLRTNLAWLDDFRGPFAVEQSLLRRPMTKPEIRMVKNFDPMLGRLVEVQLEHKGAGISPTMMGGSVELQEIAVTQRDGDQFANSTIWTDKSGEPMKSFFPALDIRVFRVTEKESVDFARQSEWLVAAVPVLEIGIGDANAGQLEKQLPRAESVGYRIVHTKEDPFVSLSRKTNQSIKSLDARSAQVTFQQTKEGKLPEGIEAEGRPGVEWTAGTDWIDFQSNGWKAFRESVSDVALRDGQSARSKAIALRDALRAKVKTAKGDQQIRKLESLLNSLACNSTEHTLLLAHLMRDQGIPTRIAIGYKVAVQEGELVGLLDTWIEAYDGTRWFVLDEFEEGAEIIASRIKVRESAFANSSLYDELRSVAAWGADAKIELLP